MTAIHFAKSMIRKRLPIIERYARAEVREHAKAAILQAAIKYLADRAYDELLAACDLYPDDRSYLRKLREHLAILRYLEDELDSVRSSGAVLIVDRYAAVCIHARIRRYEIGVLRPVDGEEHVFSAELNALYRVRDLIEVFDEKRPAENRYHFFANNSLTVRSP